MSNTLSIHCGPKGLQLEVGARSAPRLLVHIVSYLNLLNLMILVILAILMILVIPVNLVISVNLVILVILVNTPQTSVHHY